ncbi:FAD-binding oxidoreductase [Metaclostridioides mangenotii]|uniref:FAD-binding PCMH-type domain-containing protein n=1 Tax=Metaclostridioides mangenotii TaxID=1540 RepID=A0ABS4EER4_9FIRM|nr:FAD-dependent oxidoreductase [Clostridioides mangenotii]MBP1856427.1 hypothetical protein [Clostridioides mangenotii]
MNFGFFAGLTGNVVTHCDKGYLKARHERNLAIQTFPLAIVFCKCDQDVVNAVCWCQENNICFRVRNGRHHYAGYSTGNNVLVIDVSNLNTLKLDEEEGYLVVGGGVNNEKLYRFVSSRGYPFPGGSCPSVGLSGYVLGGGWGYSARHLGLGCDSLVEAVLIDYNGRRTLANSQINPDLFWALRGGGGGNFGIIVSMKFKLPKKVDKVTFIQLYYPNTNSKLQCQFLKVWQEWLVGLDSRITLGARIYNSESEGKAVFSRGIFYGTPEEAKRLIKPLTNILGVQVNIQYLPFLDVIKQIESSYPAYEKFESVSGFVGDMYSNKEISEIVDLIQNRSAGSIYAGISLYAMGGAIKRKKSTDTAFYYRKSEYIIWLDTVWEDNKYEGRNLDWIDRRANIIRSISYGSYVNFPYSELYDYMEEYYGYNQYKLLDVKCTYDPHNVFRFPQSIR